MQTKQPSQALPQMLNERLTAEALGCSVAALRRWRREKRGPRFIRLEKCVRYSTNDIARYLERNTSAE